MSDKIKKTEWNGYKKSRVKAAGVKSILIKEDEMILTSFGKGAKATIEKSIKQNNIINIAQVPTYDVEFSKENPNNLLVKGKNLIAAKPTLPITNQLSNRQKKKEEFRKKLEKEGVKLRAKKEVGGDQLFAKSQLEKHFFGQTYNDNIKIQLIYNILDIGKVLAPYINDIIYSVNNLTRKTDNTDYISKIWYDVAYENREKSVDKFYDDIKEASIYYADLFYEINKEGELTFKNKSDVYNILRTLSFVRQEVMHGRHYKEKFLFNDHDLDDELKNLLDQFYKTKINDVNNIFLTNNEKVNFQILDQLYSETRDKELVYKLYYNYVVKQEEKNLGFSVKKIRESLLKQSEFSKILDHKFDSWRPKLYTIMDFIIYEYYQRKSNQNLVSKFIEELRTNLKDEEKESSYESQARKITPVVEKLINNSLLPLMDVNKIGEFKKKANEIAANTFDEIKITDKASYFTKILYFISLFLDGKEINDIFSTIINKLENIASFLEVDENEKEISTDFSQNYQAFLDSSQIAEELKIVKAITRMKKKITTKNIMYLDAAYLLGYQGTGAQDEDYKYIGKLMHPRDNEGEKLPKDLRNFIIDNVIESRRFLYLVRHVNPKGIKNVANNQVIIKFVIDRLPETQVERYYSLVTNVNQGVSLELKREKLAKRVTNLKFSDFREVKNNPKTKKDIEEKELKKSLVGLYLTILYQIYKNLVYVNMRYTIAFYAHERDTKIKCEDDVNMKTREGQNKLVKLFMDEAYLKIKQVKYLETNIKQLTHRETFNQYRNQIVHLNAIKELGEYLKNIRPFKTYFALYHYINQASLLKRLKISKKMKKTDELEIKKMICKRQQSGEYSKDLLHILHSPFGYNQARYKNLSIESQFDKNQKDNQ